MMIRLFTIFNLFMHAIWTNQNIIQHYYVNENFSDEFMEKKYSLL